MSGGSKHITVACVLWKGEFHASKYKDVPYDEEWVEKLASMVSRRMTKKYEFVCLSNEQFEREGIRVIPLEYDLPGWWSKMELFRKDLNIEQGRVLYLDLDLVLLQGLDAFIGFNHTPMMICPSIGGSIDREPDALPGYNSSVMAWNHPECSFIWDEFIKDKDRWMETLRGDQDFLKSQFPMINTYPEGWVEKLADCFVDKKRKVGVRVNKNIKILLSMPIKNNIAARYYHLIRKQWR